MVDYEKIYFECPIIFDIRESQPVLELFQLTSGYPERDNHIISFQPINKKRAPKSIH